MNWVDKLFNLAAVTYILLDLFLMAMFWPVLFFSGKFKAIIMTFR